MCVDQRNEPSHVIVEILFELYGYTWYHFCIPNDLPAKPMIRINIFEYNTSSYYSN